MALKLRSRIHANGFNSKMAEYEKILFESYGDVIVDISTKLNNKNIFIFNTKNGFIALAAKLLVYVLIFDFKFNI